MRRRSEGATGKCRWHRQRPTGLPKSSDCLANGPRSTTTIGSHAKARERPKILQAVEAGGRDWKEERRLQNTQCNVWWELVYAMLLM